MVFGMRRICVLRLPHDAWDQCRGSGTFAPLADHDHSGEDGHQAPPSNVALRVAALESLLYPYETHHVYRMQGRQTGWVGPNRLGRTFPHRPVLRLQREAFQQDEIRLQIQLYRGRDRPTATQAR
jgi:hypothetical protein